MRIAVPPIMLLLPFASYFLSLLLLNRLNRLKMVSKLRLSEQRFKTMFNEAPLSITLTNTVTGKFEDVNAQFCKMVGLPKEKLQDTSWMDLSHPDEIAPEQLIISQVITKEIDSYSQEKRSRNPDGSYFWTNVAITALRVESDEPQLHLCMSEDITERKFADDRILYANTHDQLTDLYNREHFEGYVRIIDTQESYPLAIALGDINGLKLVNDAFGHATGDDLLRKTADIIRANLRENDYCARIGSDEMLLFFPATTVLEAEKIAGKIQSEVSQVVLHNLETSISFGFQVKTHASEDLNELIIKAENDLNRRKLFQLPSVRGKAIYTIINTLHEKNKREELHSQRVSRLCARMGEALGMGDTEINELRTVGLLHDIGKIAISESILNKEGKLSDDEYLEIKRHPEIGYRLLGSVPDMGDFAETVLAHHERLDGKGYPKGLSDAEIPLHSKIITIVDSYDAMTAQRTYRSSFTDEEAIAELLRCSGTQFDPQLVDIFVNKVLATRTITDSVRIVAVK
jgi:diguanylate cyclase (GGDEF)-like protein/PAS domain S-box-containing protein